MGPVLTKMKNEPARIGALITAVIALLIDMGVSIDPNVALRLTALAAIVFGEGVRQRVSPANTTGGDQDDLDVEAPAIGNWDDDELPEV